MAKFKFYDGSQWVELAKKTDIPSAVTESTVSGWGFTKNAGTVTSVCSQSPSSGNVSLTHANIGAGNLTVGNGSQYLNMRSGHDNYDGGIYYSTPGNEAMVFAAKNPVTSFIFKSGLSCTSTGTSWQTLTPDLQIKNGKVTINKLIANDTNGSYNLDVNGTLNATTIYENGTTLANTYQAKGTYAGTSTATQSANGLMSSADKTKLDGIPAVGTSDKDKYLHTNSSTGALEWSGVSGGGSMTVATTSAIGAIKVAYVNTVTVYPQTASNTYLSNYNKYGVQLDVNNKAFVAVPSRKPRLHQHSITLFSNNANARVYFDLIGNEDYDEHYDISDNFYGLGYMLYYKNYTGDSPMTKFKSATGVYNGYPVVGVYGTNGGEVYVIYLRSSSLYSVEFDTISDAQMYDNYTQLILENY